MISGTHLSHAEALTHAEALCSHTHKLSHGSLRRNHPHRRTTIAISPGPELRRSTSITIAIAPIGVDREIGSIAISRSTLRAIAIAPIGVDRDHRNQRDRDRDLADLARSVDRRFARSRSRSRSATLRSRSRRSRSRRSRSRSLRSRSHRVRKCPSGFFHREIDLSWVLFEFLGMNDIMCLFGS